MYDVRAIANWFLDKAELNGETLTAMKLQKLIYVSHGWSLAFGKPLVHEAVEAWKWGPVFRSIYREFKEYGSDPIEKRATAFEGGSLVDQIITIQDYGPEAQKTVPFLDSVWDVYGGYSASQLSDITHRKGTPWHQMYVANGNAILPYTVIPNDMIKAHYEKLLDERTPSASTGS